MSTGITSGRRAAAIVALALALTAASPVLAQTQDHGADAPDAAFSIGARGTAGVEWTGRGFGPDGVEWTVDPSTAQAG